MDRATSVEPTNETARTSGCDKQGFAHSPSPWTTLKTPSGSPDSTSSSPSRTAESGTFSEGLSTNVFPHVIATGNIQSGTITGKLNGVIPTHTPSGWRIVSQSTCAGDIGERLAHEQAGDSAGEFDHFDSALNRRPRLGDCFAVLARDEPRKLVSMSRQLFAKPEHHPARSTIGVSAQAGNAAAAVCTARSTSSGVQNGTVAMTLPVDGLYTGPDRPDRLETQWPPIKIGTCCSAELGGADWPCVEPPWECVLATS